MTHLESWGEALRTIGLLDIQGFFDSTESWLLILSLDTPPSGSFADGRGLACCNWVSLKALISARGVTSIG
jgi:hypothetical protein